MSHNVSERRRRAEVMAAQLTHFATWEFDVRCANCGEAKRLAVADLVHRFGALQVSDVVGRLRCSIPRCKGRPSRLILRRGGYEIVLMGLGA